MARVGWVGGWGEVSSISADRARGAFVFASVSLSDAKHLCRNVLAFSRLFVCLFLLLFWSLVCFVASDFLTTICHLAILNVCVIIICP